MRKILKRKLPAVEFIRKAVETGVHESLHRPVPGQRPGQQSESKVNKYPIEYEILSLNPPIPLPPKIPKKELRQRKQAVNPADKYVKAYMRRYDARMRTSRLVTDAERQDYYYKKTLGIESSGPRAVDMNTAMGLKSPVLKHAYDFALKQYEVISSNDDMTEKDSIAAVEKMLADEEAIERTHIREKVKTVVAEKNAKAQVEEKKKGPATFCATCIICSIYSSQQAANYSSSQHLGSAAYGCTLRSMDNRCINCLGSLDRC